MRLTRLRLMLFLAVAGATVMVAVSTCHRVRLSSAPLLPPSVSVPLLPTPLPVSPPVDVPLGRTFTVAAAGDIAGEGLGHALTAGLLRSLHAEVNLAAILVLGDLQYPSGLYRDFLRDYNPTWGQPPLRSLTRPVPGNHEYDGGWSEAEGYFDYWNGVGQPTGQAGVRGLGYYSFDIGDWHLVALNTSDGCRAKVPCEAGSPQHRWLVADLAANHKPCVLAYFHHPRFQQGNNHEDQPRVAPLWDALYDGGADLVLSGHEHNVQQLAPMDKQGRVDRARGIRSFVVGTGGARPYVDFRDDLHPGAGERRATQYFGVLALDLSPGAYVWRFEAVDNGARTKTIFKGSDVCR